MYRDTKRNFFMGGTKVEQADKLTVETSMPRIAPGGLLWQELVGRKLDREMIILARPPNWFLATTPFPS